MEAWVTLATNDSYSVGALTLAASLKRVNTSRKLVIMVTSGVSAPVLAALHEVFDEVATVDPMDSGDLANLSLLERTELGITFTKIHCWTLTKYSKAVFLDADTLVLQNSDELFEREEFSASPDAGWPDCFNSGVFVFQPSLKTYEELARHSLTTGSFDGGDQGLLNTFFSTWAYKDISKHLPFIYNMVASATYSYLPAFKRFGHDVKIVHFIGANKPWLAHFDSNGEARISDSEKHTSEHLRLWWQIFSNEVRPVISKHSDKATEGGSSAGSMGSLSCLEKAARSESYSAHPPPPPQDSRSNWEDGKPDYKGTASFDKILSKIDQTMSRPDTPEDKDQA